MEVDHVSKSNVEADLECTICLDPSVSPIHSCTNGHIVCGICCDKIKNCGICGEVGLIKNGLAERLAQKYVMKAPCKNFQSGCKIPIKSTEMKAHMRLCEYRPIHCIETEKNDCTRGTTSFGMREFVEHLKHHHKIGTLKANVDGEYKLWSCFTFQNRTRVYRYPPSVWEYNGQYFLLHEVLDIAANCLWITVLGVQTEADKYYYTTQLTSPSKNIEVTWKLPVLPFHKGDTFEKVVESGQCVRLDYKMVAAVQECPLEPIMKRCANLTLKLLTKSVDSN